MSRAYCSFFAVVAIPALVLGWCDLVRKQQSVPDSAGSDRVLPMDERGQALQAEIDRCYERVSSKKEVVRKVLAGQLTLREAAVCFEELDATQCPRLCAYWRTTCPGDTDEERYCWTILRFVAADLQDRPCQARAFRKRVEWELPEHVRRLLADDFLSTQWYISRRPTGEQAESLYK